MTENIVWGCAGQIFGAIRAEAAAGARAEFLFFWSINQRAISPTSGRPNFTKFPQKGVFQCVLFGFWKSFCENLPVMGIFPQKPPFGLIKVNDFRLPAATTPK